MLNLDPGKLLVIAVVAIILLGPDRLPQVARQVGGAWKSFNEFRRRVESEVRNTVPDLPPTSEIARLARSPSALLNHLSSMSDTDTDAVADAVASANGSNGANATGDGLPDGAYQPVRPEAAPAAPAAASTPDCDASDAPPAAPVASPPATPTTTRRTVAAETPPTPPSPGGSEHPHPVVHPTGPVVAGDPTLN